ncbi:MAG: molybdopterin-dependent oxidoreductase [Chloroflexota bacterium]
MSTTTTPASVLGANAGQPERATIPVAPPALAALSGIVAAALALGVGEIIAGVLPGAPSPVVAVGGAIVNLQPAGAKDFVVALFGTNDKLALNFLVVLATLAFGAAIGLVGRRHPSVAVAGIAALAVVGLGASLLDPQTSLALAVLGAGIAAVVGRFALLRLLALATPAVRPPVTRKLTAAELRRRPTDALPGDAGRRRFLVTAAALGGAAVVSGAIGRSLVDRRAISAQRVNATVPRATEPAARIPAGADLQLPGVTPLVMPNDRFYRIDTALVTPSVDVDTWQVRVDGMVDRPTTLTFDQLVALPIIERYVTIACVSNEVGGDLVGNAKWAGPRLTDLLDMAGVKAGATQIVGRSVDGFTVGFPTSWVTDTQRDAMVAVRMNDQPLPTAHGFPARLIVPGLYGYVSATKWLAQIELTTLEAFDAFWVPRGWSKEAPILTQSRIDVPSASVQPGVVPVAGVAWAPERGISKVEVRVDDGPWRDARLAAPISAKTWVQWRYDWDATGANGQHILAVRATDGTGAVQDEGPSPPAPDGARGYHTIGVTVG